MTEIDEYIESLTGKEKIAYLIAKSHLGSTFSMEKSNGFIEWKQRRNIPPIQ